MTTLAHAPRVGRAAAAAPSLRRRNAATAALHLVQGVLGLALASAVALPVTTALVPALGTAFEVQIAPLVAAFLFLSAAVHLVLVHDCGIDPARRRDHRFGERVSILRSPTVKPALAWRVFAGTPRPV